MSKSVKIEHDGATYTLAYTKRTVQQMEAGGFVAEKTDAMPATMIPKLFSGAFLCHHPFLKESIKDKIYDLLANKADLIAVLVEMYNETLMGLVDEPEEDAKKVTWTVQ